MRLAMNVNIAPVTGRKSIYVNPQFTLRIEGLVPEYQFRLRWSPDTIVLWDNRSTQHYAANDYYPQRRRMERTAVVGDVPY
jgi:taurine dioxygenase